MARKIKYTDDKLKTMFEDINNGKLTYCEAVKKCGISRYTLEKRYLQWALAKERAKAKTDKISTQNDNITGSYSSNAIFYKLTEAYNSSIEFFNCIEDEKLKVQLSDIIMKNGMELFKLGMIKDGVHSKLLMDDEN